MEGHTLLTGEQLFPYANKDMELVCGSLLTVRDGTIQVIHLTVKEFLEDKEVLTDPTDSYTQLIVDPTSAGLQLTLVSLEYISKNLTEPIVNLGAGSKFSEIDESRQIRLVNRLKQRPFTEYASINWLIHFVDCEGVSSCKIVEAFQNTFNSKATFCWIEMCLHLDPSSFQRIRVGLEEILEWADDTMHYAPRSIKQYTFLKNWCSTIPRVIDEIRVALHPEEIYLLDFSEIFYSNGLAETYNNHGQFVAREIKTLFANDQSHLRVQANTSIHQLQPKILPTGDLGIFIYDQTRDVFITANWQTENFRETLYVQAVKTGHRLLPLVDLEEGTDGIVLSSTMSTDGKYLGIVYELYSNDIKVSIWQIDSKLDFKKRMRSGSWARKVFSKEAHKERCVSVGIMFGEDGRVYYPLGRVQPATGIIIPFPHVGPAFDQLSWRSWRSWPMTSPPHYFNTKGDIFFGTDGAVIRYSIQDPESREHYTISKPWLVAVGPTGRHLLLGRGSPNRFCLYDTTSKTSFDLPRITSGDREAVFKFSEDETRLFCLSSECEPPHSLEALVMDLGGSTPRVRSYGKCNAWTMSFRLLESSLSICDHKEIAWCNSLDGIVYSVDLSTPEIIFPKDLVETQNVLRHYPQVSRDGMCLSLLHYGNNKAYVEKFNLNTPEQPARRFDLVWSECNDEFIPKKFSDDASILVSGVNLYHLPNEDQLPVPVAIEPIPIDTRPDNSSTASQNRKIWVSHNNDPTAYVSCCNNDNGPSLHRIDLNVRSSVEIDLDIPRLYSLYQYHLEFHPWLPLALLSCHCKPENSFGLGEEVGSDEELTMKTLDLNDLNIMSVRIPQALREISFE